MKKSRIFELFVTFKLKKRIKASFIKSLKLRENFMYWK